MGIIRLRCSRKTVVLSGLFTHHRPVGCCEHPAGCRFIAFPASFYTMPRRKSSGFPHLRHGIQAAPRLPTLPLRRLMHIGKKQKTRTRLPAANRFGSLHFGGPNRDRTDDLTDAKRHIKLFCIISNYLWYFPLSFSFFPPLFRTPISMCCAAVCGVSCGQKRSPPFAGNGFPAWTGSIFRASNCLHCTSEGGIKQVISVPSRTQKMGGCKQKEIPRFQRLRKLKRIFMRFPHSP